MEFNEGKALLFKKLGDWKIMALASSVNDTLSLSVKYQNLRNTLKLVVVAKHIIHCSDNRL